MIHLKIDGHIFSTEDWSEVEKLPGYLSDVEGDFRTAGHHAFVFATARE